MSPSVVLLIARRELGAYLRSLSGYLIIAALLALLGLLFNGWVLGNGEHKSSEVLRLFFYLASGFTMVASVLLSFRLLAEERQTGTLPLLYSSPVRDVEIVTGKYLAALFFLTLFLVTTVYMPALIFVHGKVSYGHILCGYLGLFLLGATALAIGVFGSALASTQLVAVIISAVITVGMLSIWYVARVAERPLSNFLTGVALWNLHFQPFMDGILHVRDVVYYLAVTYVFLFASTRVLEARRWR